MYSSIPNQLFHIGHYAFAIWFLFIWYPKFIFSKENNDWFIQLFSNSLRIVGFYIIVGYLLVGLKLFEVLAILALLIFILFRKYFLPNSGEMKLDALAAFNARFYDLIETTYRLKLSWKKIRYKTLLVDKRESTDFSINTLFPKLFILSVFIIIFYVRFYDAWASAAPSMSDGAVTLAWLKYINERVLFQDGIYPQGLYIILAYLQKFAAIDAMYIVKYTGPVDGTLIVVGIYFFVSRLTGNRVAAIVAAAVYGLGGESLFGHDWFRQSATNAQEFALVFLLPTFYFFICFFRSGNKNNYWTGTIGCMVIGFIHSVIFAYVGLGLGIMMFLALVIGDERKRKFWMGLVAGIGSVLVSSLIPLGTGLLLGRKFHSSSAEFALQKVDVTFPLLGFWDILGIVSLFVVGIAGIKVKTETDQWTYRFVFLFGLVCFLIYYFAGTLTQNAVLSSRTGLPWMLSICILLGFFWNVVISWVPRKDNAKRWIEIVLCSVLIISIVIETRLQPIIPYKMVWDSVAEQHLRIAEQNVPSTWVIFSQSEGYSMVLVNGFHQYISTLINDYDPNGFPLTKRGGSAPDPNVSYHIYIFEEKEVYRVDKKYDIYTSLEPEYERREIEYAKLRDWLKVYQSHNGDLQTFYEDQYVKVHYIHRKVDGEAGNEAVWGKPRLSIFQKDKFHE